MNLFYLDENLDLCAEYHVDKHIVKMPLEVAQILCTAVWVDVHLGFVPRALNKSESDHLNSLKKEIKHLPPESRPLTPYLPMMYNHPCTIWANESLTNTWWLLKHGLALCAEYTHRYGKVHSCQKTLEEAESIIPFNIQTIPTSFTRAMPDEYKHDTSIDTFTAYKNYIRSKPWVASNYLRDESRKPDWI